MRIAVQSRPPQKAFITTPSLTDDFYFLFCFRERVDLWVV